MADEEIIVETKEAKDSKVKEFIHKVKESKLVQLGAGAVIGIATWEGGKILVDRMFSDSDAEATSPDSVETAADEDMPF